MAERSCSECGRAFGVRRRCYWCNGPKKKTGETRNCGICKKPFYAARWQIADVARNTAAYCSKKCKYESFRLNGPGCEYPRTDGYIAVYYPTHPDAAKNGMMLKHRLVAEQKYGRRVLKSEHVHHINGVRNDNRPENLEIVTASVHAGISNKMGAAQRLSMRAELEEYRRRYGPLN